MLETVKTTNTRKKIIINTGLVFMGVILLLTFFSKTINNMLIPEVECYYPSKGQLDMGFDSMGEIKALETREICASGMWYINDVKVKAGSSVKKGDVLGLVNEDSIILEIKKSELEIETIEEQLNAYIKSYNSGKAVSSEQANQTALPKESPSLYKKNIEIKRLEIKIKKDSLKRLKNSAPNDGKIKTPVDGVVKAVLVKSNTTVNPGQVLFEIGESSKTISVQWRLDEEKVKLIKEGDRVQVYAGVSEDDVSNGKVSGIEYAANEGAYRVTASIEGGDGEKAKKFQDGQQVKVSVVRKSKNYDFLVPNSSIAKEMGQSYIFVLRERSGALGEEKYVEKVAVKVEDSNDFNSAVKGTGIKEDDNLVVYSSKVLADGMQVKLK